MQLIVRLTSEDIVDIMNESATECVCKEDSVSKEENNTSSFRGKDIPVRKVN